MGAEFAGSNGCNQVAISSIDKNELCSGINHGAVESVECGLAVFFYGSPIGDEKGKIRGKKPVSNEATPDKGYQGGSIHLFY